MQGKYDSGQKVGEYCGKIGITPRAFYYWQKKLREAICKGSFPVKEQKPETALTPRGWSAVEIAEPKPVSPVQTLAIEVGGCRVLAEHGTDADLLAKVCKVLTTLC